MNDGGYISSPGGSATVKLAADECILNKLNGRIICIRNHEEHDPKFWLNGAAQVPVAPRR